MAPPPKKIVWDPQKIDGLLLVSQGEFAYFDFSYNYITFMITTKKGVWGLFGWCLGLVCGYLRVLVMSEWCLGVSVGCLGVSRDVWEVSGGCLRGVWGVWLMCSGVWVMTGGDRWCLGGVWWVSGGCLGGVLGLLVVSGGCWMSPVLGENLLYFLKLLVLFPKFHIIHSPNISFFYNLYTILH